jgi:hypothetical protein
MAETQKEQTITIDDKEYKVSDLSPEQINLVNHVADLDRKLDSARFNVDQLQVGRNAFMNMLTESLNKPAEEATEEAK